MPSRSPCTISHTGLLPPTQKESDCPVRPYTAWHTLLRRQTPQLESGPVLGRSKQTESGGGGQNIQADLLSQGHPVNGSQSHTHWQGRTLKRRMSERPAGAPVMSAPSSFSPVRVTDLPHTWVPSHAPRCSHGRFWSVLARCMWLHPPDSPLP